MDPLAIWHHVFIKLKAKNQQYRRIIAIIFTCLCSIPTTIAIKITTSNFIKITNCRLREFATWIKNVKNTIRNTFFSRSFEWTLDKCSMFYRKRSMEKYHVIQIHSLCSMLVTVCTLCAIRFGYKDLNLYESHTRFFLSNEKHVANHSHKQRNIFALYFVSCIFRLAKLVFINQLRIWSACPHVHGMSKFLYQRNIDLFSRFFFSLLFCFLAQYDFVYSAHICCV